jgi:hypothetical protein
MDQKGRCLSAASFGLSHFLLRTNGNPKGKSAVAFFCLHFLGEARKVSSYRATPGRQSRINDKNINKTVPPARRSHAARRLICSKKRMEYAL